MTETVDTSIAPAPNPGAKNDFARLRATIARPRAVTDGDTVLATVDIAAPRPKSMLLAGSACSLGSQPICSRRPPRQ